MTELHPPESMRFRVLRSLPRVGDEATPRLGQLICTQRGVIDTPNYFGVTSRGAVPHLTPDVMSEQAHIRGSYLALEDFVEKFQKDPRRTPPVFDTPPSPDTKPAHKFTSLPSSVVTVLGPRRIPPIGSRLGNGRDNISIFTATGFQTLTVDAYAAAIEALRPDITIPMVDLAQVATPGSKRGVRMAERAEDWMKRLQTVLDPAALRQTGVYVFAPTLPVPYPIQWEYLNHLADDLLAGISGLAVYDAGIIPDLKDYPALEQLPRLSLDLPASPHELLRQIALGVDVFVIPFINHVSDSGVALAFTFPPPKPEAMAENVIQADKGSGTILPLGEDMSLLEHAASVIPLSTGCTCYTCTTHHRAYVRHLLDAHEMLAWTLLQIHNHHVLATFFAGVRASLAAVEGGEDAEGCPGFQEAAARFAAVYEPELPQGLGIKPRARGYHAKSEGSDAKMNRPGWGKLNSGCEEKPGISVEGENESVGRVPPSRDMETPLIPEGTVEELVAEGFGSIDRPPEG